MAEAPTPHGNHAGETQIQLTAFRVGEEEYVVDIMRVREIIRPLPITSVRRGPRFVEGVIDLRGEVIPVVDLRRRFGLPMSTLPSRRIVIVTIENRIVGLIVDQVTEVVRTSRSAIRPAAGLLDVQQAPYFLGVCQHKNRMLLLLNLKNVVATEEAITLPPALAALGKDSAP